MKHIKLFETETEFNGATLETPWIALTKDDMMVHMPLVETENCIICKLTTTEPNQVCGIGDVYLENEELEGLKYGFSKVIIDGVEINLDEYSDGNNYNEDEAYFEYTFAEVGKHTLKYYLLNETEIKDYSFYGSSIESAIIPSSVTSIGEGIFQKCSNLTSIIISTSITSIGNIAFQDCTSLTSITIPNSVTSIGSSAFNNTSLTSIEIPNSVTSIGHGAFHKCSSLASITYNGTMEQWNNGITKGSNWHYDVPSTTVVTCTDGTVALD